MALGLFVFQNKNKNGREEAKKRQRKKKGSLGFRRVKTRNSPNPCKLPKTQTKKIATLGLSPWLGPKA